MIDMANQQANDTMPEAMRKAQSSSALVGQMAVVASSAPVAAGMLLAGEVVTVGSAVLLTNEATAAVTGTANVVADAQLANTPLGLVAQYNGASPGTVALLDFANGMGAGAANGRGPKLSEIRGSFKFSTWNPFNYTLDPTTFHTGGANFNYKIPWSRGAVGKAARLLEAGESSVTVATRAEAEELFLRVFQGRGPFRNTTGMSPVDVRNNKLIFPRGKTGTYHFDDLLDASGRVEGHGVENAHGGLPHLQIHDFKGKIYRIFFGE